MGATFSAEQRNIFFRISTDLKEANIKFSKKELKKFIKFLFIYFPNTYADLCGSVAFWDTVCETFLTLSRGGDLRVAQFVIWPHQMRAILQGGRMRKKGH